MYNRKNGEKLTSLGNFWRFLLPFWEYCREKAGK
jgi:hypothetical protein